MVACIWQLPGAVLHNYAPCRLISYVWPSAPLLAQKDFSAACFRDPAAVRALDSMLRCLPARSVICCVLIQAAAASADGNRYRGPVRIGTALQMRDVRLI